MGELGEDWEGVVERRGAARFKTGEGHGHGPMVKRGGAASFETGEGRGPMVECGGASRFETGGRRGPAVGGGPGGGAATLTLADATALR